MADDIKSILPSSLRRAGITNNVKIEHVKQGAIEELKDILGEELLKKVRYLYFKDRIITFASLNDDATQKINYNKERLIENINYQLEDEMVIDIRVLT